VKRGSEQLELQKKKKKKTFSVLNPDRRQVTVKRGMSATGHVSFQNITTKRRGYDEHKLHRERRSATRTHQSNSPVLLP